MSVEMSSFVPAALAALPEILDASRLLAIAALGCLAGGLAAFVATRRPLSRIAWRLARFEQLANSTSMDLKTLLREGERFDEIARELHAAIAALAERHDHLELRASGGTAWEHAIELARMGLSPEQLMSSVGVTRGEAELLAHLHRGEDGEDRVSDPSLTLL